MKLRKMIVIVCISSVMCGHVSANTGAAFLSLNTSARAAALGGAFVGIGAGASAINYNPAGLALLNAKEIVAQHTEWIADIQHDYVAVALPVGLQEHHRAIGVSLIYLTQGTLEGRDENRVETGSFDASDRALTLSYAGMFDQSVSYGINARIIQQKIADETANGMAIDTGILWTLPLPQMSAGVSILNLGPQMKFISEGYDLPLTVVAGVGYKAWNAVTLACDIQRNVYGGDTDVMLGAEYLPLSAVSLRIGYLPQRLQSAVGNDTVFARFSGGIGLAVTHFSVDYSFVPYGDLGATHQFCVSMKF